MTVRVMHILFYLVSILLTIQAFIVLEANVEKMLLFDITFPWMALFAFPGCFLAGIFRFYKMNNHNMVRLGIKGLIFSFGLVTFLNHPELLVLPYEVSAMKIIVCMGLGFILVETVGK